MKISTILNNQILPDLLPIQKLINKVINDKKTEIIEEDNAIKIDRRVKIGTDAFAIVLFDGLQPDQIIAYENIFKIKIPALFQKVLLTCSGADIFEMSIYGISKSMLQKQLLNRESIQPHDLAIANKDWKSEFKGQDDSFHFGGAPLTDDENIGYFYKDLIGYYIARNNGEILNKWSNLGELLETEIKRLEPLYKTYEKFMFNLKKKK